MKNIKIVVEIKVDNNGGCLMCPFVFYDTTDKVSYCEAFKYQILFHRESDGMCLRLPECIKSEIKS
jgi:hypothetical protein